MLCLTQEQILNMGMDLPQSGSVVLGSELSSPDHSENGAVKVTNTGGEVCRDSKHQAQGLVLPSCCHIPLCLKPIGLPPHLG
jgi:hypothetical protein